MTQIISYREIEDAEGFRPQNGMNFKTNNKNYSIVLMSVSENAPYEDKISEDGKIIDYVGHNLNKLYCKGKDPYTVDQPLFLPSGKLTQNGKFAKAANYFKDGLQKPEKIRVYQKLKKGLWSFNGVFDLVDVSQEESNNRKVHIFKLVLSDESVEDFQDENSYLPDDNRIIPGHIMLEVFKRDKGQCTKCPSKDHLHFDHIIPFSKGGTSKDSKNIRLLCRRHNLKKSNKIGE